MRNDHRFVASLLHYFLSSFKLVSDVLLIFTLSLPQKSPRLVLAISARSSLAPRQRSLPRVALRNHAATNPRCRRHSLLRALSGAFPHRAIPRRSSATRSTS